MDVRGGSHDGLELLRPEWLAMGDRVVIHPDGSLQVLKPEQGFDGEVYIARGWGLELETLKP